MKKLLLLAGLSLIVLGCGKKEESGLPFVDTLNFIRTNGVPTLSDLMPSLPDHFSSVDGVTTSSSGLPKAASNLAGSRLSSADDFQDLLDEAKVLSAQGFSEARRVEALIHNLTAPVFNMLGKANMFGDADTTESGANLIQGDSAVNNIFDTLLNSLNFVVDLEQAVGMPQKLLISNVGSSEFISISGLWNAEEKFATGFRADLRIPSLDDFEVKFTFTPGLLAGLIQQWSAGTCLDDLWQVTLKNTSVGRTAEVASIECPKKQNSVTSLGLTLDGDELAIAGAFVQSFPDAHKSSLRGWLGKRQGFVLQGATNSDLSKVAAAAAVLGESDFSDPSSETIDQFGVGRLLSRFIQGTFWQPRLDDAKNSTFPAITNMAYWTCLSDISGSIRSSSKEAKQLCKGDDVSLDGLIVTLEDLADHTLTPGSIEDTITDILAVLNIRNSLFITSKGDVAYQDAPDNEFKALNKRRSDVGVDQLDSLAWKSDAKFLLPTFAPEEVPEATFANLTGSLTSFLNTECSSLLNSALEKSNKSNDGGGSGCAY